VFSVAELVEAFDVTKVNPNMARFDLKKAEAINAVHLRALPVDEFVRRVTPYLVTAGVLPENPDESAVATLTAMAPMVQERISLLGDAAGMLRFLFTDEDSFAPEPDSAAKALGQDAQPVLAASLTALSALPEWTTADIEHALKAALVDGLGLKPRKAFAPVRVAVTGRTVSPPLYESMELLGRERTLARLRKATPTE
jgi:glutamyl-tRNA synthetase